MVGMTAQPDFIALDHTPINRQAIMQAAARSACQAVYTGFIPVYTGLYRVYTGSQKTRNPLIRLALLVSVKRFF